MNNATEIAAVLYTLGGLFALWLSLAWWRAYRVDRFRQDLFALRAELFDYALEKGLPFDNVSYVFLRKVINSMIRFAHEVSFVRLASAMLLEYVRPVFRRAPSFKQIVDGDEGIWPEARVKVLEVHFRLAKLTALQILLTSFVAAPSFVLYAAYTVCRHGVSSFKNARGDVMDERLPQHIRLIEQQAVETRDRDQEDMVATAGV